MLNEIKNLTTIIDELQTKINKLENKISKTQTQFGLTQYQKNLLNYSIANKKTISLLKIRNKSSNSIFVQVTLNFSTASSQDIEFGLIVNNILISSTKKHFNSGYNSITIFGQFKNINDSDFKISTSIKPVSSNIILDSASINIFGEVENNNMQFKWDIIETESQYILVCLSDNKLYYNQVNKQCDEFYLDEFIFIGCAKEFSIAKDNINNSLILFTVNTNDQLFYSNFPEISQNFLLDNCSRITSAYENDKIYISYIHKFKAFVSEFSNGILKQYPVDNISGKLIDCYLYFNNHKNRYYLLLTKDDGTNYMLESTSLKNFISENISAVISFNFREEDIS